MSAENNRVFDKHNSFRIAFMSATDLPQSKCPRGLLDFIGSNPFSIRDEFHENFGSDFAQDHQITMQSTRSFREIRVIRGQLLPETRNLIHLSHRECGKFSRADPNGHTVERCRRDHFQRSAEL